MADIEISMFDLKRGEKSLSLLLELFDSSDRPSEQSALVANARDIHAIVEQLIEAADEDVTATVRFTP